MNETHPRCSHTVTISPENRTITAGDGDNLLALLASNAILLRSDCGGRGVCGKCRVQVDDLQGPRSITACTCSVEGDLSIVIPETSMTSPHIIDKAEVFLPASFIRPGAPLDDSLRFGVAVDLGTTTIAVYLVDRADGQVLSSLAVKNPQSLYGDDVMSRIGYIGDSIERLAKVQRLTVGAILWAIAAMTAKSRKYPDIFDSMVIVGNPTMIHLLLGICPASIGISPYAPGFYEARDTEAQNLGLQSRARTIRTLPQIAGFIGGDILAAALAVDLDRQPPGTLLIDLGTNGELMLKGEDRFFATSCATGPAFEGATISCGMQAVPGAIDRILVDADGLPSFTTIAGAKGSSPLPLGICGSGIISGIAAMLTAGVIEKSGALSASVPPDRFDMDGAVRRYVIHGGLPSERVAISQKDIRHVQLGKAALISGIEFLLAAAGIAEPHRILVAGAFGSHLNKDDLLSLGMLPPLPRERISMVGNAAGSGAIITLCNAHYLAHAQAMASQTTVINLATNAEFQNHFVTRLSF